MKLSLYVDDKHVETIPIFPRNIPIATLMKELRKKYAALFKETKTVRIVLGNVPSRMNNFRSLME